jgi:5-formyltetrahydrofolate cyclo-ligase
MTSPAPTKPSLRAALLAARGGRPAESIAHARAAIASLVLARWTPEWACVAAYEPLRTEPGSPELLAALRDRGARVIVPVLLPDGDLDWREWPDAPDLLGPGAIRDAALVLVPALAVDRLGMRLGRGGGSYDRALARLDGARGGIRVAALLYDDEHLAHNLPSDPWDRSVDDVVTPTGWRAATAPDPRGRVV